MLGHFQVAPEYIYRLPTACPHDRRGVIARTEQVLGSTHAQGVAAESIDVFTVEARCLRGGLHEPFYRCRAEVAVDCPALIDRAKEKRDVRRAPGQPILNRQGRVF